MQIKPPKPPGKEQSNVKASYVVYARLQLEHQKAFTQIV